MAINYKQAGVDIEAGDRLVDWLKTSKKPMPHRERLISGIGGFAAVFRGDFPKMKEPCLVTCTDGVGTKVKLAVQFKKYAGVGQDLVAMSVNDMICSGAEPLFFLDYYATGKLDVEAAQEFLAGVRAACEESDCALIGGETAEMPDVYRDGDFDCAGFSVGVVDRPEMLGPHLVKNGDRILGVSSSGFHSNGYSLVRKVFAHDIEKWADQLLTPTALYVKLSKAMKKSGGVHAMAHITGGGIWNLPRVLPKGAVAQVKAWPIPELFLEVERRAEISRDELLKTLNCGVGLMIMVDPKQFDNLQKIIEQHGFKALDLGVVEVGRHDEEPTVRLT